MKRLRLFIPFLILPLLFSCTMQQSPQFISLSEILKEGEVYFSAVLYNEDEPKDSATQATISECLLDGYFTKQVSAEYIGEHFYMGEGATIPGITVLLKNQQENSNDWIFVKCWGFSFLSEEKQHAFGHTSNDTRLILASYSEYEIRPGILPSYDMRNDSTEYWLYILPVDKYAQIYELIDTH